MKLSGMPKKGMIDARWIVPLMGKPQLFMAFSWPQARRPVPIRNPNFNSEPWLILTPLREKGSGALSADMGWKGS